MKKLLTTLIGVLLAVATAGAATFTYSELTSTTTQWSAGTSWDATPVSAADTILIFTGSVLEGTNVISNNDIVGNFQLNQLDFTYTGTASSPSPTITISGGPLEFTGAGARINYDPAGATAANRPQLIFDTNIVLSNDLIVDSGFDGPTSGVVFNGAISGANGLTFTGAAGATVSWLLSNSSNSYAGDTRLVVSSTSGRDKILRLGDSEVIPHGAGKGNLFFDASNEQGRVILELNGNDETVNGLASGGLRDINVGTSGASGVGAHRVRNTSATAATLTIGDTNASATFIGMLEDGAGGGSFGLTKTGSGEQVLSGVSTHTGTTAINGGSIKIDYSIFGSTETSDPTNYFSSQSAVILGGGTTFAIVGRGDGATTSTENVALAASDHQLTLPNEVADQLVVGQAMDFTKTGGAGTPATDVFIIAMDRGDTTTVVSGNKRMSAGASTVTVDTTATTGTTSQTLAGLTLAGAAASNAIIDFGAGNTVTLTINSAPIQDNDGSILTIANWSGTPVTGGGTERLLFTGVTTDFSSVFDQSEVVFDGYGAGYALIADAGFYEVTAIPEPGAVGLLVGGLALATVLRRRRKG